jgi:hypothetical protein
VLALCVDLAKDRVMTDQAMREAVELEAVEQTMLRELQSGSHNTA